MNVKVFNLRIRRTGLTSVALLALVLGLSALAVKSQERQASNNTADQMLRSSGRVNPSSLGLEIEIPLIGYPGRGINLPLGLNYSSKQWRLEEMRSALDSNNYNKTWVVPRYSENAAGGWTSSLSQPYIEYTGEKYRFQNDASAGIPISQDEILPTPPPTGRYGDAYMKRITVYMAGESHELLAQEEPIGIAIDDIPAESVWNTTFYATDGSGIRYVQDSASNLYRLYLPNGSFYDFNSTRENKSTADPLMQVRRAGKLTDVNGNYVQFNAPVSGYPNGSWTDQLGRTFPVLVPRETPVLETGEMVKTQSFTLPGMSQPYILKWKPLQGASQETSALTNYLTEIKYVGGRVVGSSSATMSPALFGMSQKYGCMGSSVQDLFASTPPPFDKFNPVVLTEIILPNGASYRFSYNEYGEIERIFNPMGGREEIKIAEVPSLAELEGLYKDTNRGVIERKIYESDGDATPDVWTYSAVSSPNNYRTSVIAPDLTQVDRFMHRGVPETPCNQQQAGYSYSNRWGYDNVFAGMQYEERRFSSSGAIVERQLTRWGATTTNTLMRYPGRNAQRNARVLSTESITYDGNSGLSAATAMQYDTDVDDLGSPQNVVRTTEYAFKTLSDGSTFSPATPATPLATEVVTVPDPTQSATPVRMTEMVYLQSDPTYSQAVKDAYKARNLLKLVTKTFVKNGAATTIVAQSEIKYDEPGYNNPDQTNAYRGQPTTARSWLDTNNSWIETHAKFDAYGNGIEATDARGNTTTTAYDSTFHAFPIQVTSPIPSDGTYGSNVAFVTSTAFNTTTGLPTSTTDANGQVTTISYNDPVSGLPDPLLRVRKVTAANGQQTITEYGDGTSTSTRFVKTKTQIDETNWKEGYTWYDGLGRTIKSQSVDSNGDVFVETEYDNMSRPFKVTNPYRNGETVYWTESTFDTAGRPWKTMTPDGAFVETTYSVAITGGNIGTAVTVKDQSGKLRRSITNASGHLTRVDEPNAAGQLGAMDAPNQATFYTYDLLNNLTQVQQPGDNNEECGPSTTTCSQTRSFTYDSLSRLKQATNPESGTILYGYDLNSNLQTKTDARGIVTTYSYDSLNRVKTRQYTNEPTGSETPDVSYYYDLVTNAKGKLIKVTNGTGDNHSTTEYVSFDILGRVTRSKQTTDNVVYGDDMHPMTYSYNLAGVLIEQQYPSGRVVKNVLDSDGDLATVQSKKNANNAFWNYANRFTYNSAGAVTSMQLGNGRWESTQFNSRFQPTQIALGSVQNGTDKLKLDYQYGDLDWDGSVIAGSNNGNVAKQTITVAGVGTTSGFAAVQNYDYDAINRIQIASETLTPTSGTAETWTQGFKYDRYGNRNFNEATTTTLPKNCGTSPNFTVCPADVPKVNPSIDPSNNRLNSTGYTFDSAGNTTKDAENRKFTYDAENKQVKVETVDGSNNVTGTVGEYVYDGDGRRVKKRAYANNVLTEETIFAYDAGGKLIGEYSDQVASAQDAKVAYLTSDHLGSPRINTDLNGSVISRHDYHPFGDEIASSKRVEGIGYADDTVRKQFTGYERDGETYLDFAQARMHSSALGRFTSPDYFRNDSSTDEPQSWNLYLYCRNNPLFLIDHDGKKARVTYTTNLDEQTGEITVTASFAIYAKKGKYSAKELEKQKNLLLKQVKSTFKDSFKKNGITYSVKTDITATVSSSKAEAESSGADNVVGLVRAADLGTSSSGGKTLAATYNLGGSQDYITIATGSDIEANNTYAHEFGHALGTNPSHLSGGPRLMARSAPAAGYLAAEDFDLIFGAPSANHLAKHQVFAGRSSPRPALLRFSDMYNVYSTDVTQRARVTEKKDPY